VLTVALIASNERPPATDKFAKLELSAAVELVSLIDVVKPEFELDTVALAAFKFNPVVSVKLV
jgi:hypothetical protein